MARRKPAEMELLPAEDDQPSRGKKKLVEAEHIIKYSAPVPVTVEEPETDEMIEIEDFEETPERKRKPKNERAELRKRLGAQGVTASSQLKLSIERYLHSDSLDSGTMAEKEYCTKYGCNEAHITGEDYLDVARQFGPGRYWFTLRLENKIVTQWERRLNSTPVQSPQMLQHAVNGDPTSPQVVVMPGQQVVADPFADLDKTLKVVERLEKMRQAFGLSPAQNPAPVAVEQSPEERLATVLLTDPDVKKKAIKNLLGSNGEGDSERGTLELLLSHAGEIGKAIEGIVDRIFSNVNQVRNGNGQQQAITQTTVQPATVPTAQSALPVASGSDRAAAQPEAGAITPESQLLNYAIGACLQNWPIVPSAEWILAFERENPSVAPYVSLFISVTPADALSWLAQSVPNAQQAIQSAPHAETWVAQLQAALNAATDEEQSEGCGDGNQETTT